MILWQHKPAAKGWYSPWMAYRVHNCDLEGSSKGNSPIQLPNNNLPVPLVWGFCCNPQTTADPSKSDISVHNSSKNSKATAQNPQAPRPKVESVYFKDKRQGWVRGSCFCLVWSTSHHSAHTFFFYKIFNEGIKYRMLQQETCSTVNDRKVGSRLQEIFKWLQLADLNKPSTHDLDLWDSSSAEQSTYSPTF